MLNLSKNDEFIQNCSTKAHETFLYLHEYFVVSAIKNQSSSIMIDIRTPGYLR